MATKRNETKKSKQKIIDIIDNDKQIHSCTILNNNKKCFWDKHDITSKCIISCPLKLKPPQIIKIYKHPVSNERYTIKENVSTSIEMQGIDAKHLIDKYLSIEKQIEAVDTFCSFNCCLSYILDNQHDPTFINSENILRYMWDEICPNIKLVPAPSWRLIEGFGGNMSIQEFRNHTTLEKNYIINGSILEKHYLSSRT